MIHQQARRVRDRHEGGFTLIELVITVAIIAIIAAIAMPNYTKHIARAKRADARTQLMQAAQYMQRFYSANDSYKTTRNGQDVSTVMPANLQQSPADSTSPAYRLQFTAYDVSTFTLSMTPVAGGGMDADECGSFTINSAGVRGVTGATQTRDNCWK